MQDRRILIPIAAAVILTIVTVVRISTNKRQDYADQVKAAVFHRPAPTFEALDSDNRLVRLAAFLGRQKIIVVFFDGDTGADKDEVDRAKVQEKLHDLIRLRERFSELQAASVKVIAVGTSTPWVNRHSMNAVGDFPFPLLSDFDPQSPEGVLRIYRQWGRLEPGTNKPRPAVFLVDRKGQIPYNIDGPMPRPNVDAAIEEALK